ncbi:MAG: SIS domain-containing protein [Planctomycetota bacterium]|nr:SIS domain-containing protein [Planctomycetota bacterium]
MADFSVRGSFADAQRVLAALSADAPTLARIDDAGAALAQCIRAGSKVLLCGNGGSLCDAAHFAEELTGRFRADRRPLPAIACADAGHITCTANDYGFENVFSRWVEALAKPGDVLVVLSTSGNSANIIRAVETARALHLPTIALLGKGGGRLGGRCTHEIIVPGETSDRIQELHMLILHAWVEAIEASLGPPA